MTKQLYESVSQALLRSKEFSSLATQLKLSPKEQKAVVDVLTHKQNTPVPGRVTLKRAIDTVTSMYHEIGNLLNIVYRDFDGDCAIAIFRREYRINNGCDPITHFCNINRQATTDDRCNELIQSFYRLMTSSK
ncbi:hypothetical protein [Thalassotalea maritima]|uniref:hypothetical protein n=1 Tax=Thalassotalea maritima TaxID=3242416 RepID=UPI0035283777